MMRRATSDGRTVTGIRLVDFIDRVEIAPAHKLAQECSGARRVIESMTRPAGHHPDEIAAMRDAVPDLRKALKTPAESSLQTSSAPST